MKSHFRKKKAERKRRKRMEGRWKGGRKAGAWEGTSREIEERKLRKGKQL